jgi:hypothetical protein
MTTSHIQTLRIMLRDEKGIILPGAPNALAAQIRKHGVAAASVLNYTVAYCTQCSHWQVLRIRQRTWLRLPNKSVWKFNPACQAQAVSHAI